MGNDSPIPERFPPLSNPTYPGNVTNFTTGYPTTSGYATAGAVYPPSTPFTPEGIYPSAQPPYTAPGPYGNHAPVTEPFHHPGYRGDVPMRTQPPYSEGHHTGLPPPRQAQPEYYGAQPPAGYGGRGAPAPYDGSYYAPGPNDGQYNRPYERQPEYYDASRQGNRVPDYYEGPRPGRDTRADPRDYGNGSGSYR
ncbi:hypothetical protein MMC25_003583 [Agyrium rufum]|nr:hypothetical protein [Agyrium rufum]